MEGIWIVFLEYYGYIIMQILFTILILLVMYWGFNLVFAIANREDSNRDSVKELTTRNGTQIGVAIIMLIALFLGINYSSGLVGSVNQNSYLNNRDNLKEGVVENVEDSFNEWGKRKINSKVYIVDKYNKNLDARVGNTISYITYEGYYFNKVNKLKKGELMRTVAVLEIREEDKVKEY